MESAQGAAKMKSVAKVVALMKKLGIAIEDLKGAEPRYTSEGWTQILSKENPPSR